jgi:bisphosphoglycerate-dependent phosphoglycerate mutase
MTVKIHPKALNETHVIIADAELKALIKIIENQGEEEVELVDDVNGETLMELSDRGGSLDFLLDEREDIYTVDDLKIRYQ